MSTKPFRIYRIDPGFCRIIYKGKNRHGQSIYYSICQESETSFQIYRCCPQLEAQNVARPKIKLVELFELPGQEVKINKSKTIRLCTTSLERDIANFIINETWS